MITHKEWKKRTEELGLKGPTQDDLIAHYSNAWNASAEDTEEMLAKKAPPLDSERGQRLVRDVASFIQASSPEAVLAGSFPIAWFGPARYLHGYWQNWNEEQRRTFVEAAVAFLASEERPPTILTQQLKRLLIRFGVHG